MNTFQLTCFLTVAETLSFARAAEQLNITQPSVTHQIQSLESELGTKLFRRTTRTVEITTAGEAFFGDAQNMILIAERAKKRYENPSGSDPDILSIGCHEYSQLFAMSEILHQMSLRCSGFQPHIRNVPFKHLYRLLEEEAVDLIISFKETGTGKTPGKFQELKKVPVVAFCPLGHPLAGQSQVSFSDLESEKIIVNNPRSCPSAIALLQGRLIENHSLSDLLFCDTPEVAVTLVNAGFGITLLPETLVPYTLSPARIPIEGAEPLSLGVYYKTLQGNPLLKEFIGVAKDCIAEP